MVSVAMVSASDYLRTSFEHDAEFVDGYVEERTVGEKDHGLLQRKLLLLLSDPAADAFFVCIPELRIKVSANRYRVPDLALVRVDAPDEQVLETPPLVCIEILSPEDSMSRTLVRVRDFLQMGVVEVWVFDPESRTAQVYAGATSTNHEGGSLAVPETPIVVSLADVFGALTPAKIGTVEGTTPRNWT